MFTLLRITRLATPKDSATYFTASLRMREELFSKWIRPVLLMTGRSKLKLLSVLKMMTSMDSKIGILLSQGREIPCRINQEILTIARTDSITMIKPTTTKNDKDLTGQRFSGILINW